MKTWSSSLLAKVEEHLIPANIGRGIVAYSLHQENVQAVFIWPSSSSLSYSLFWTAERPWNRDFPFIGVRPLGAYNPVTWFLSKNRADLLLLWQRSPRSGTTNSIIGLGVDPNAVCKAIVRRGPGVLGEQIVVRILGHSCRSGELKNWTLWPVPSGTAGVGLCLIVTKDKRICSPVRAGDRLDRDFRGLKITDHI